MKMIELLKSQYELVLPNVDSRVLPAIQDYVSILEKQLETLKNSLNALLEFVKPDVPEEPPIYTNDPPEE